jgi:hypothetical protein
LKAGIDGSKAPAGASGHPCYTNQLEGTRGVFP